MIKIEIDVATGAEARLELLNLLGVTGALVVQSLTEEQKETFKASAEEIPVTTEEPVKGKRRTKAEIEADKKAAELQPATDEEKEIIESHLQAAKDEIKENQDQKDAVKKQIEELKTIENPNLQDLQRICAILVRAGYKQQGIDFIKNVGGADTSKDVAEDKRQACINVMTKFAEENKIAM